MADNKSSPFKFVILARFEFVSWADPKVKIITILADDLKPQRQARLTFWRLDGNTLRATDQYQANFSDETRARQIIAFPTDKEKRLITVGFVQRDQQILGQVIAWD